MRIDTSQVREAAGGSPTAGPLLQSTHAVESRGGGRDPAATGKKLPQVPPTSIDVQVAADLIDRFLRDAGRALSFSVDEVTGRTVVSVRDPATGQLIRQVPSEEALRIAANLDLVSAALVSEQA
jgi:flagellar protein FlaG